MSCPAEIPPPPPRGYRLMQAMMAPMMKRFGLSCREFAELTSLRMDRPLSFSESFRFRFHAMMCGVCRHFPAQFEEIRSILHGCETHGACGESSPESGETPATNVDDFHLDAAARDRILERLGAVDSRGKGSP